MFCDGASRGNPGLSAIGVSILNDGEEIASISEFIGKKTNNQAEYEAVIQGLKKVKELNEEVIICLDSQLIVKQVKGEYKVKSSNVVPLFNEVKSLLNSVTLKEILWVPREQNKRADELANQALDRL